MVCANAILVITYRCLECDYENQVRKATDEVILAKPTER